MQTGSDFNSSDSQLQQQYKQFTPKLIGLSPLESKGLQKAISQMANATFFTGQSPEAALSFLSIHKTVKKLESSNHSEATQSLLNRTDKLANRFEKLILQAESEGIQGPMVGKIDALKDKFIELQQEISSQQESLTGAQKIELLKEIDGTIGYISKLSGWIRFSNDIRVASEGISKSADQLEIYRKYEQECGLADLGQARGPIYLQHLRISLEKLVTLYEDKESLVGPEAELAKLQAFEAVFRKAAHAWEDNQHLLADCDGHFPPNFVDQEQKAIGKLLIRLAALTHREVTQAPGQYWMTTLFQAVAHPLETTQKVFDAIEKMSPLPKYSAIAVKQECEKNLAEDLNIIRKSLSANLATIRAGARAGASAGAGVSNQYRGWLDGYTDVQSQWKIQKESLEVNQQPSDKEIEDLERLLESLERKVESLSAMKPQLLQAGFSPEIFDDLEKDLHATVQQVEDLVHLLNFRSDFNALSIQMEGALESANDQALENAQGHHNFTSTSYNNVLKNLHGLLALYQKADLPDLPHTYKQEMSHKIHHELAAWKHTSFMEEYHDALDAEIAELRLNRPLTPEMKHAANDMLTAIKVADKALESQLVQFRELENTQWADKHVAKAYRKIVNRLISDRNRIQKEIKTLDGLIRETIPSSTIETLQSKWTIFQRGKSVQHTVKVMERGMSEEEETWGFKVMRACLYGLYYSDRIASMAGFAQDVYRIWDGVDSPLKSNADLLSKYEFAKRAQEMSDQEQAEVYLDINLIEGILKGFIEYTPSLEEEHPELASFLREHLNVFPSHEAAAIAPEAGSYERTLSQGGVNARELSDSELNVLKVQFLGQQVQRHFQAIGKQLEPTKNDFVDMSWSVQQGQVMQYDEAPMDPLKAIGHDMAAALQDHQAGLSPEQNPHLLALNKSIEEIFGMPLPQEWIEEWLFKQEWSEDRLHDFSDWMAQSLGAHAAYHMQHREAHEGSAGTMPAPVQLLSAFAGQETVSDKPAHEYHLEQLPPLTSSSAPAFTNPLTSLAQAIDAVRVDTVNKIWGATDEQNAARKNIVESKLQMQLSKYEKAKADIELLGSEISLNAIHNDLVQANTLVEASDAAERNWMQREALVDAEELVDRAQVQLEQVNKEIVQKLAEKRSVLQLQSFVQSAPTDMDDRLYQHLLGSYFGKGTGLEGYSDTVMLDYVRHLIALKINALKENPLCDADSKLEFCRTLFESGEQELPLKLFTDLEKQVIVAQEVTTAMKGSGFVSVYRQKVHELKPGESFFFQGGWMQENGGSHAIVFEVVKQPDGLFSFRAYNRGAGLEYHTGAIVEGIKQYLPFTEILDITSERIASAPFLIGLQELQSSPKSGDPWQPVDLYDTLLPTLGGKFSHRVYSKDQVMEGLEVGHCTYLSLTAVMSQHLGDQPTYSRWQLEMELKTLSDYYQGNESRLSDNEQTRRLMREGLSQFGRNMAVAYREGLITDQEVHWIQSQMDPMIKAVAQAETTYLAFVEAQAPVVDIQVVSKQININLERANLFHKIDISKTRPAPRYHPLDTDGYVYNSATFHDDLSVLRENIANIRKSATSSGGVMDSELPVEAFLNIKAGIKTFIGKIPLKGDVFWEKMSPQQGQEVLNQLASLSQLYLLAVIHAGTNGQEEYQTLYLQDFLVQAKILTLSDALMRHFSKDFGFETPLLALREMLEILDGDTVFGAEGSVEWSDEQRILRDYWMEAVPKNSLGPTDLSFFAYEPRILNTKELYEDPSVNNMFNTQATSLVPWPDLEFAKQWLKRPDVMAKFDAQFPQFKDETEVFKAFVALGDQVAIDIGYRFEKYVGGVESQILPPQFFDLRDISFATAYLLKGAWFKDRLNAQPDPKILVNVKREKIKHEDTEYPIWRINYSFDSYSVPEDFGGENDYDGNERNAWVDKFGIAYDSFIFPEWRLSNGQGGVGSLMHFVEMREDKVLKIGYGAVENRENMRMRISPHRRLLVKYKDAAKVAYSYQKHSTLKSDLHNILTSFYPADTQELLALSSNDELQVSETLAYFTKYPHKLREEEYRQIFQFLMTEKGLFIDEMLQSSAHAAAFVQQVAQLIQDQYDLCNKLGDSSICAALLEVKGNFNAIVKYTLQQYPDHFDDGFVNPFEGVRESARAILDDKSLTQEIRTMAAFTLLKSFMGTSELSIDDATVLLYATVQLRNHPIPQSRQYLNLLRQIRGPIAKAMEGDNANIVINALIKKIDPEASEQQWNIYGDFPMFLAADGFSQIDVLKGDLLRRGQGEITLPDTIRKHDYLKSMFGSEERVLASRASWQIYTFKDKTGNDCIAEITYESISGLSKYNQINLHRKVGDVWYEAYYSYALLQKIPFKSVTMDTLSWASDSDNQIYLFDSDDKMKYRIKTVKAGGYYWGSTSIVSVHRLDSQGKDTGEVLTDIYTEPDPYEFLKRVEEEGYVRVWKNESTHEPTLIELPRLGLEFDIRLVGDIRRAYSKQVPGYYIASKQYVEALGDMTPYLVLEKEEAKGAVKQVVLMPSQQMSKLEEEPLITKTELVRRGNRYVLHDVNPVTHALMPRNEEARFHLSMMYLWERDYDKAVEYLRGYESQLRPYSEEELEIIQWIKGLAQSNHDETPQARGARMYAHFLEMRNLIDFKAEGKDGIQFYKKLNAEFSGYAQVRYQMGKLRLKPDEELFLFDSIDVRLKALKKTKEKELVAKGADSDSIQEEILALNKLIIANVDRLRLLNPEECLKRYPNISIEEESALAAGEWGREDKNYKDYFSLNLLKEPDFEPSEHALLRSPFTNELITTLFHLLKDNKLDDTIRVLHEYFTGIKSSPEISVENLKAEVIQALWIIRNSKLKEKEQLVAAYLGCMIETQPDFSVYWKSVNANIAYTDLPKDQQYEILELDKLVANWTPKIDTNLSTKIPTPPTPSRILSFISKLLGEEEKLDLDIVKQPDVFELSPGKAVESTQPTPVAFRTSIEQKDIALFNQPVVANLETYLTLLPPSQTRLEQAKQTTDSLSGLFSLRTGDNVADRMFAENQEQLRAYGDSGKGIKDKYVVKDFEAIHELKES